MRIATSTIYAQQTAAIDDQAAHVRATSAQQLSSGKQLNAPSDDPDARSARTCSLHISIDTTTQQSTNVKNAVSELTSTDSALSSLTSVLQSARTLAIQGASDTLTARPAHGAREPDRPAAAAVDRDRQHAVRRQVHLRRHVDDRQPAGAAARQPDQRRDVHRQRASAGPADLQQPAVRALDDVPVGLQLPVGRRFARRLSNADPAARHAAERHVVDQSTAAINRAGQPITVAAAPPSPAPTRARTPPNVFATTPVADTHRATSRCRSTARSTASPSVQTVTVRGHAPLDGGRDSLVGRDQRRDRADRRHRVVQPGRAEASRSPAPARSS